MQLDAKKEEDQTLLLSKKAGCYLNGTSVNSKLKDKAYKKLITKKGKAKTVHGILLLAAHRIYYDVYNNDGGNIIENIHDSQLQEGDVGYREAEYVLDSQYQTFFDELEKWMPLEHQPCVAKVKKLVLSKNIKLDVAFDQLIDRVLHTISTRDNLNLPAREK